MKAAGQSFSLPVTTWLRLVLVLASVVGGFGCKPKIGDDCANSVDCSYGGDRICDVTQPDGYCTVFNCEPNLCPDESVCVAFSEGTCSTDSVSLRFRRTFCMRTCEDDGDCRGGSYHCVDISRDDSRRIVDTNPSSRRICAIPSSSAPSPPPDEPRPPEPAVCFPSDASFDVSRPETGPISQDARPDGDRRDGAESSGEGSSEAAADGALDSTQSDTTNDAKSDAVEDAVDEAEATLSPP